MTTIDVLFLLVVYGSHDDADAFIAHAQQLPGIAAEFAVCDNSPGETAWTPAAAPQATVVRRPDNPGYLEGALVAFEQHLAATGRTPAWVCLTNTDVELRSSDLADVLAGHAGRDVVLAPRVTESDENFEMNPHLVAPRPVWRHVLNRAITITVPTTYLYLLIAQRRYGQHLPPPSSEPLPIYSPYGATMFFAGAFFAAARFPRRVPLLAEEFAIAEICSRAGVPVLFEPRIHVHHRGHSTTGSSISMRRARQVRTMFRYVLRLVRDADVGAQPVRGRA